MLVFSKRILLRNSIQCLKSIFLVIIFLECTISKYKVEASKLIIKPKPDSFNEISGISGESFVISCGTSQLNAKELQWKSPNNKVITSDSNQHVFTLLANDTLRLFFDKLMIEDSGLYTCAFDKNIFSQAYLDVKNKINLFETPTEQQIEIDKDQLVTCRTGENQEPTIQWYKMKDEKLLEIKNSKKYQITVEGLLIKNVDNNDEGVYKCYATIKETGEAKRIDINVSVNSPPLWKVKPLLYTEEELNRNIIFKCEAYSKPMPTYKWTKNGEILKDNRISQDGTELKINKINYEDMANYSCVAENELGRIEAFFKLNVLISPEISFMEDVYALEGEKAVLKCRVPLSNPPADIKWKFSGSQVFIDEKNDEYYKIQTIKNKKNTVFDEFETISILMIKKVSKLDTDKFTCIAINKVAVSQEEVKLIVEFKPELMLNSNYPDKYFSWLIQNDEEDFFKNIFLPVEFSCLTEGQPIPSINWYFKDKLINEDSLNFKLLKNEPNFSKLEVKPNSLDDFGEYLCVAENKHGYVKKKFQLIFATKPKLIPIISEKIIDTESIILEIKQNFTNDENNQNKFEHNELPIEAYQIQWIKANSNWSEPNEIILNLDKSDLEEIAIFAEIKDLLPDTEYIFRSAAINKAGVSDFKSNEIIARTKLKTITTLMLLCILFILTLFVIFFIFLIYYLVSLIIKTYKSRPKYVRLIVRV